MFDKNQPENRNLATIDRLEGMHVHEVAIEDAFQNQEFDRLADFADELMASGYEGDSSINLARRRGVEYNQDNPATQRMIESVGSFKEWRALVPSAAALDPIYNPNQMELVDGTVIAPELSNIFRNWYDCIGIRSRAQVMKDIILSQVELSGGEAQNWASVACGTALPVFSTLNDIRAHGGVIPQVTLADYDPRARRMAIDSARKLGLQDYVVDKHVDIVDKSGVCYREDSSESEKAHKLPFEAFDIVDAVGILEYMQFDETYANRGLGRHAVGGNEFEYGEIVEKSSKHINDIVPFLENIYDLVKPGGMLIVGNMRDTHPQLGITLNVIQWPYIQPRSLEQMAKAFKMAHIDGEIDAYCPDDNVYAIYAIHKPM